MPRPDGQGSVRFPGPFAKFSATPMRYRTSRLFQERFGLRAAGDLPALEGFELSGPEAERVRLHLVEAGHLPDEDGRADGE